MACVAVAVAVAGLASTLLKLLVSLLAVASGLQTPHHGPTGSAMVAVDLAGHRRPTITHSGPAVIAVDLGNTNSCVAGGYAPAGGETAFHHCIPSYVAFTDEGATLVGEAAVNHAAADPESAIFGFKRLFGLRRHYEDEEGVVKKLIDRVPYKIGARNEVRAIIQVKGKEFEVEEVASMVVAELKRKAEVALGLPVRHAVVTVPQHFNDAAARAAEDAAKFAGLDVVRTVSEPFAAALAHGLYYTRLREGGSALVLHVGGGTAAATVVTLVDGAHEVIAHRDDPFLGGDDFDGRTAEYFAELIKAKHGRDFGEDRVALGKLRAACERAKKALAAGRGRDHVRVSVESLFDGVDFSEPLTRAKFEELNDDMFRKVMALVEGAMGEAELEGGKVKIDEIVLVGGSTMIPKIQRLVSNYFGGKELNVRVKPDEAVVLGAAIEPNLLNFD